MRVRLALISAAVVLAGCGADDSTSSPTGTTIRTIAPETTLAESSTPPTVTAYRTIPTVTAAPPVWAPLGWRTEDVTRFESLIADGFEELGAEATIYIEAGYALLDSGTRIPLQELADELATAPVSTWQAMVSTFMLDALSPLQPEESSTYEGAGPLLRIRVAEPAALGIDPANVVGQEIVPGLYSLVVYEGLERLVYLTPEQAASWGKLPSELILQAASQTMATPITPSHDGSYTTITNDRYASSRIIDPASVVGTIDPASGVIVTIPNTDVFLAVRVDPSLDVATLTGLRHQLLDNFSTRPDPASDDVYWWHDGVLEVIPFVGEQPQLPAALTEILNAS